MEEYWELDTWNDEERTWQRYSQYGEIIGDHTTLLERIQLD